MTVDFVSRVGIAVEEFHPLAAGDRVGGDGGLRADVWSERVVLRGATVVRRLVDGPDAGEVVIVAGGVRVLRA